MKQEMSIWLCIFLLSTGLQVFGSSQKQSLFCTGYAGSPPCTSILYFNQCKHSIKIIWSPLKYPGNHEFTEKIRNHCSIQWTGKFLKEEKKYPPKKCAELMALIEAAIKEFPDLLDVDEQWQNDQCLDLSPKSQGMLGTRHDAKTFVVGLDEVGNCELYDHARRLKQPSQKATHKRRYVHCPVLPAEAYSWLQKFLIVLNTDLKIQNPLK